MTENKVQVHILPKIILVVICLIQISTTTFSGTEERIFGVYRKPYTVLTLLENYTFQRIVMDNECDVNDYQEIIKGNYKIDTQKRKVLFYPDSSYIGKIIQSRQLKFESFDIDKVGKRIEWIPELNYILYGPNTNLLPDLNTTESELYDIKESSVINKTYFNLINSINGCPDFNECSHAGGYAKMVDKNQLRLERNKADEHRELIFYLGEEFENNILFPDKIKIRVREVFKDFQLVGVTNPNNYSDKWTVISFESDLRHKLTPGMMLYHGYIRATIIDTSKEKIMAKIYENNSLGEEIEVGDEFTSWMENK